MSKRSVARACSRCVGRTNVFNPDSLRLSFILYKCAQLIKRPAMQSTAFFFRSNALANIFQIFHHNRRTTVALSFRYDFFGNTVINMSTPSLFLARDFPQSPFSGLRTFALKALSVCQKLISRSSKSSTSKQFACGCGGKNIFPEIHPHSLYRLYGQNIRKIENKVKKPALALANKLSFFDQAPIQKSFVKRTDLKIETSSRP